MIPSNLHVLVVTGPGLVADLRLLTEVADREFAALGVGGTVSMTSDLPGFRAALESPGALVVVPGPDPGARGLFAEYPEAVWLDLTKSEAPPPGGGRRVGHPPARAGGLGADLGDQARRTPVAPTGAPGRLR